MTVDGAFRYCAEVADAFAAGQKRMIAEEGPDEACRGGQEVAEFIAAAIRRYAQGLLDDEY